mmetsp:Transcript_44483/g.141649  ORF Transcript_44483/g.141649 Transcript_44483/m.141649 type:complete len:255 (-) Transcript_44483:722-1486(-)
MLQPETSRSLSVPRCLQLPLAAHRLPRGICQRRQARLACCGTFSHTWEPRPSPLAAPPDQVCLVGRRGREAGVCSPVGPIISRSHTRSRGVSRWDGPGVRGARRAAGPCCQWLGRIARRRHRSGSGVHARSTALWCCHARPSVSTARSTHPAERRCQGEERRCQGEATVRPRPRPGAAQPPASRRPVAAGALGVLLGPTRDTQAHHPGAARGVHGERRQVPLRQDPGLPSAAHTARAGPSAAVWGAASAHGKGA